MCAYRPDNFYEWDGSSPDAFQSRQQEQLNYIMAKQQRIDAVRNLQPGSKEHRQYWSQFADLAYNRDAQTRQDQAPEGWVYDTQLSNRNRSIWYNQDTGQVVLSERGTIPKGGTAMADLATDGALALGVTGTQSRFRNSLKTAKAVQKKYGDYELVVTGHSLGGSITKYLTEQLDCTGVVFSAHLPTRDILSTAIASKNANLTAYTVPHDPVGAGMYLAGSAHAVAQTSSSPHDLSNFLV